MRRSHGRCRGDKRRHATHLGAGPPGEVLSLVLAKYEGCECRHLRRLGLSPRPPALRFPVAGFSPVPRRLRHGRVKRPPARGWPPPAAWGLLRLSKRPKRWLAALPP